MQNANYLNIHVLISHSPSCLNRDDANMQKSAIFGGVRRVRISSQCLKRAIRKSDYYAEHLGQPSIRSNKLQRLVEHYVQALKDQFPPAQVERAIRLIAGKEETAVEKSEEEKKDDKKQAIAPWCLEEIKKVCQLLSEAERDGLDSKKIEKKFQDHSVVKQVRQALGNAVDVALSGRMATSGIMLSVDGAASVAHTITTHSVDADIDWFTAVDDLVEQEGEVGAGHLSTQEFGAGVFYRYASINLPQLQINLGDVNRERALEVAAHFVHLFATSVPQAKQRTFAAYNPADLVAVSFGGIPISGANAFEKPVERDRSSGGFLQPSIKAFETYITRVRNGYGLNERSAVFSLWPCALEPRVETMGALKDWVRRNGE